MNKEPYLFDKETQQGMEIDIVCKVLKNLGYDCMAKQMPQVLLSEALIMDTTLAASAGLQERSNLDYYYSEPYIYYEYYAITHTVDQLEINHVDDLIGQRIAVFAGAEHQLGERFFELFNPHDRAENAAEFYEVNNHSTLISLLFNRTVDVLVVDRTVFHWYKKLIAPHVYQNEAFRLHGVFPEMTGLRIMFASRALREKFNEGLNELINSGVYQQMIDYYLASKGVTLQRQFVHLESHGDGLHLTTSQKSWLKLNSPIHFSGDPAWLPFGGYNAQGNYVGMVADYLELIEDKLGITFIKHLGDNLTRGRASLILAQKPQLDVITASISNQHLYTDFNPVKSFITNPVVMVRTEQYEFIESLEELQGVRVAVARGASYGHSLIKHYPQLDWRSVSSVAEGLEGVSLGQYDAMIVTMAVANYYIGQMGLYNLRIVGRTDVSQDITLFVNKSKPILHAILEETLHSISVDEHQEIGNRWIKQRYIEKIDHTISIIVMVVSLFILSLLYYWNRRLRYEMQLRRDLQRQLSIVRHYMDQQFKPNKEQQDSASSTAKAQQHAYEKMVNIFDSAGENHGNYSSKNNPDIEPQSIQFLSATILLIDQRAIHYRLIQEYTYDLGIQVIKVQSYQHALAKLAAQTVDLVLLDLYEWYDFDCDLARGLKATIDIPVLAIGVVAVEQLPVDKLTSQLDGYLQIPLSRSHLLSSLCEYLPYEYH